MYPQVLWKLMDVIGLTIPSITQKLVDKNRDQFFWGNENQFFQEVENYLLFHSTPKAE